MVQAKDDCVADDCDTYSRDAQIHTLAIERVILAMRERLQEPLSLLDMAQIANLSPYHFSRVFHRHIGIPPGIFLTALRLAAAKRLLLTTSLSVTDICFEVGYASLGSFITRFTQLVGLPPRHLRQAAEHFVLPAPESLVNQCTHTSCFSPFRNRLLGQISVTGTFTGIIFVGLFPKPIPQGRPVRFTLLAKAGSYTIASVPDGRYFVMAAALPLAEEARTYLLPDSASLMGTIQVPLVMRDGRMQGLADVNLRPPRLTDPPMVVAIPLIPNPADH
jgi:AraC family transcriptional regulator